jgi:hypothetical protein
MVDTELACKIRSERSAYCLWHTRNELYYLHFKPELVALNLMRNVNLFCYQAKFYVRDEALNLKTGYVILYCLISSIINLKGRRQTNVGANLK